jgi:hypothetical protein
MAAIGIEILQLFKEPLTAKVFELFAQLIKNKSPSMLQTVAKRFDQLLESHHLNGAELLSLVPSEWGWNLSTVENSTQISKTLQAECFSWFANTFQVNESWLKGSEEQAVTPFGGYKHLETLGTTLRVKGWVNDELKMTILAEEYSGQNAPLERYAIVFSKPIAQLDEEKTIYKHILFEPVWRWDHLPCRLETKVVARWYSMVLGQYGIISIIPVKRKEFEQLIKLKTLPGNFITLESGGYDHFEDRVMKPDESQQAIEAEEIDAVIEQLENGRFLDTIQG